jgi:hydrogenase-4 component E
MLYVTTTSRLEAYIKMFAVQGFIFFLLLVTDYGNMNGLNLAFLVTETLLIKGIIIPAILIKTVRKYNVFREVEPYIPSFYSVAITTLIFVFGFVLAYSSIKIAHDVKPLYFAISISTIITGFFIIMTRKKIITHILGYMFVENGIFLLSLSTAKEMPLIVNLGILLDIFVGVFLLVLVYKNIKSAFEFEKISIDQLSELRD